MVICAKTAELIEMPFGLWTWVSPRKHVLHGAAHWRHLANTIEPSMFSGPTKIDEPVKNPFGVWTWVGAKNHILDGVQIAPCQGAIFRGKDTKDIPGHVRREIVLRGGAQWHNLANTIQLSMFGGPTKMAELIEMPFRMWAWVGPRNHVLDGVQIQCMVNCKSGKLLGDGGE